MHGLRQTQQAAGTVINQVPALKTALRQCLDGDTVSGKDSSWTWADLTKSPALKWACVRALF